MDSSVDVIANRAQGYAFEEDVFQNDRILDPSMPYSAGALLANANDLIKWQQLLIAGKVVSPDSYALMTTPTILPSGTNTRYGFGLVVDEYESHQRVHHGGGIFGFNSTLAYFPESQLHVAVISNGERLSSDKIAREIIAAALGIQRATVQNLPISEEEFKPFTGHFKFERIEFEADFMWVDGKPHVQGSGQPPLRLLYQGNNEFRAEFDNEVRFVFADDHKSFMLHQNGAEQPANRTE
jgi:hypothetical protein